MYIVLLDFSIHKSASILCSTERGVENEVEYLISFWLVS